MFPQAFHTFQASPLAAQPRYPLVQGLPADGLTLCPDPESPTFPHASKLYLQPSKYFPGTTLSSFSTLFYSVRISITPNIPLSLIRDYHWAPAGCIILSKGASDPHLTGLSCVRIRNRKNIRMFLSRALLRTPLLRSRVVVPSTTFRRNMGSVSAIDSAIFRSLFGTDEIRKVCISLNLKDSIEDTY